MAYRTEPSLRDVRCHRHDAAPASGTCYRCMQPVCDPCVMYVESSVHCPPCAISARRARVMSRGALGFAICATLVGGAVYLARRPPQFDYGQYASRISAARARVAKERCDRTASIELEDTLNAAGDYRGAIADADAFIAKCGDWYRVHWTAYTAHHRLSENESAVREATRLIEHNPTDKDYRWWRGVVYEEMGKLPEATADYRETLRLQPDIGNIPFNLANVLERQGDFCGAKRAIEQYVEYHRNAAGDARVMALLARLGNQADCEK